MTKVFSYIAPVIVWVLIVAGGYTIMDWCNMADSAIGFFMLGPVALAGFSSVAVWNELKKIREH